MAKPQTTPKSAPDAPQIYHVSIKKLLPHPNNPRTHDAAQIALIARSIEEYGFTNPVLIDEGYQIIAGHGRLLAAEKLGRNGVPTLMLKGLTAAQKKAYVIADNQIALGSGWNKDLLALNLRELETMKFDLTLTGFTPNELNNLLEVTPDAAKLEVTPEVGIAAISKLGDIWLLGDHRVMCGDSTSATAVAVLLGNEKPALMVTDPPYGVEYDPAWRADRGINKNKKKMGEVLNDDRADWTEAWKLFPGNIAYVWHASLFGDVVKQSLEKAEFKCRAQLIWAKDRFSLGRSDYHWQHEPCWYAVKGTGNWTGDRKQTTVWEIAARDDSGHGHSTQKPVECMRRPIINNSLQGDHVYDPFLGSGTTVIACEAAGRIAVGMELNPLYVDVIVKRWQNLTGKKAVHAKTGREFPAA